MYSQFMMHGQKIIKLCCTFSESLAKILRDLRDVDTRPGKIELLSQRQFIQLTE